jgi:hypothetical protein
MMQDERIIRSRNDIAAQGFRICLAILAVALFYRQLYLEQHPREYWDVLLAFFASAVYVNLMTHARGATLAQAEDGSSFPRMWRSLSRILVVLVGINLFRGEIELSLSGIGGIVLGALIGAVPVVLLFYLLDRWWKRRSGLEE